ncbi:MAG: phosphoribosylformylglycinamidine cyclo-ligase [Candidatus Cloacimonetes bacterium]|nr:phosphoribosylformylglycinamidine cyclo-ligase [Candidatus Cloacimonadota bacterium]
MDYKQSGVDIEAGEKAVSEIKNIVRKTYNSNVLTELGSFGGLYNLDLSKWKEPVMVASTDGVGTKLIIAQKAKKYDTIGQDLINHCVNDIFVQGAIPQFFLDYIGVSRLDVKIIKIIIEGMAQACIENGLSLIGGEMAEMPDIYQGNDFDLVGTIIGLVEKSNLITGSQIQNGDVIIGYPSNGLHTNGYTLARKIIFDKLKLGIDSYVPEINSTIKDSLLQIHKTYFPMLKKWAYPEMIHGMAHITGGGLEGNLKRIIPEGLIAYIDCKSWEIPSLFQWLVTEGEIKINEAFKSFNMGIGFVIITSKEKSEEFLQENNSIIIGNIQRKNNGKKVLLNF